MGNSGSLFSSDKESHEAVGVHSDKKKILLKRTFYVGKNILDSGDGRLRHRKDDNSSNKITFESQLVLLTKKYYVDSHTPNHREANKLEEIKTFLEEMDPGNVIRVKPERNRKQETIENQTFQMKPIFLKSETARSTQMYIPDESFTMPKILLNKNEESDYMALQSPDIFLEKIDNFEVILKSYQNIELADSDVVFKNLKKLHILMASCINTFSPSADEESNPTQSDTGTKDVPKPKRNRNRQRNRSKSAKTNLSGSSSNPNNPPTSEPESLMSIVVPTPNKFRQQPSRFVKGKQTKKLSDMN